MKFYKIIFFSTIILGTLIAVSSYSWIRLWIGLEINLLSIIPLMKEEINIYSSEAALKYFLTQTLASRIFLFSLIISLAIDEFFPIYPSLIINTALLIKLGAAPFHSWFPEVMEGLNWNNRIILLTWQKLAPIILIFYSFQDSLFYLFIIVRSTIIRGILGLNQISLRKIIAYSSINHIRWILAGILHSQIIWLFYFIIYRIIRINIIIILKFNNIFYLRQLFNSLNSNKLIKFFFILNFLSLGGLPPFLGFFPKWLVVNHLILNNLYVLRTLIIIFTLITLYFYLRISFSRLVINTNETTLIYPVYKNFLILRFNLISLSGLLTCTLMFNFI